MYNSSTRLCLLFAAILLGCALAQETSNVKLEIFEGSSVWWIAVKPLNDRSSTTKVELKDSRASDFAAMAANPGWGYYSIPSTSGRGFSTPLTFRLTSNSGAVITVIVNSIVPSQVIDTGAVYGGPQSTTAPTSAPTSAPTTAPTTRPTTAPTTRPTTAPTTRPTTAPTSAPTTRPTTVPTAAPTTRPTSAPTAAPTTRPTSAPTAAPTARPTSAPTAAPTARPTSAPTTAPTTRPTTAPTTRPTTDLCSIVPVSTEPVKLLVPLYVYPGAAWDALVAAASKVKIIAIINPNSGPLSTVDSSYTNYMNKLKNAGIEMVGYVYTSYGVRALSAVQADIDMYASKYPLVTGIFLDEAANDASKIPFYTSVYNAIMAKPGYKHSILNPGVAPAQGYMAISTNIMIYENYATSLASTSLPSWVKCAPNAAQKSGYQYKFSGIVHTASASNQASYINTLHNMGIGLVYITDGAGGCCTYNTLTSYFAAEAAAVQALNGN